jgi:hypothetical protein
MGYGPPVKLKLGFNLKDWSSDESNKRAWTETMEQSKGHLRDNPFDKDSGQTFAMADFGSQMRIGSQAMNKARHYGWCGFVDSLESIFEMYKEMGQLAMLPSLSVDAARPLGL